MPNTQAKKKRASFAFEIFLSLPLSCYACTNSLNAELFSPLSASYFIVMGHTHTRTRAHTHTPTAYAWLSELGNSTRCCEILGSSWCEKRKRVWSEGVLVGSCQPSVKRPRSLPSILYRPEPNNLYKVVVKLPYLLYVARLNRLWTLACRSAPWNSVYIS